MAAQAHVNPVFAGATIENWSEIPSSSNRTNEGRLNFNSNKTDERRLISRTRKCVAIVGTTCFVIVILATFGSWWFWIRPVHGSYSSWSQFGPCSKTCGGGVRNRTRQCNNPEPKYDGRQCSGSSIEVGVCGTAKCPVNGSYSSWSEYGPCSKTCGGGVRNRTRQCNNPEPKYGGKQCSGPSVEVGVCGNVICPGSAGTTMVQQFVQDIVVDYHKTLNSSETSTGRFQKAIFSMQREVANENAFDYFESSNVRSRRSLDYVPSFYSSYRRKRTQRERLDDMKKIIKIAANGTDTEFARSVFAKSLFIFIKKEMEDGTSTSEISKGAQGYLEFIKLEIGESSFAELMSQNGAATLMFAIDTTGSMSDEINAAKGIATSIVNRKRDFPVDYILSPFNDPGTGPLTYKSQSEREEFVSAIAALSANGGGDCPELAFKGMIDAFRFQPQLGSPMFVFTDATSKDATSSNIETLKALASYSYTTINFFIRNICGSGIDTGFAEIASYTSGQIFPLQTDSEIEKFKDYVEDSLKDSVIITEGRGGSSVQITLDGEITLLLITMELRQANTATNVRLVDPLGNQFLPILTTTYTCIFKQKYPMPGTWQLKCPVGTEIKTYSAKSAGNNTIDFTPYFLHSEKETSPVLSVDTPVTGENTTTMLQIAGSEKLDSKSLLMDVLNEVGNTIHENVKVEQMTSAKSIFRGTMKTPTSKFRIRLKGLMKTGLKFTRYSQITFQASSVVMLTIKAGYEHTATAGNKTAPIYVYLYSNTVRSHYTLTATSTYGSTLTSPSSVTLEKGTNTTVTLQHNLPNNVRQLIGKVVTIKLGVVATSSSERREHKIKMMYVP